MTAPLTCRVCQSPFEPVGANHTHDGRCNRCRDTAEAVDRFLFAISPRVQVVPVKRDDDAKEP